ncbi:MAG: ribonuclease T2 [Rhodobacteraceae bacterium]|nr:ribonuclease T2 [Paracoccaceae bacterium]MCP5342385.1 ribonuclease T2 [Paracoccaceae bacterium]
MRLIAALILWASPAFAEGEPAGDFDYFVLSLGWSPTYCRLEGDARGDDQCDPRHGHGFILHGLWPQYEQGWPSYCRTAERDPSRAETAAMADIMGSGGLAWYEWKKHGRYTGMSARSYFAASRRAYHAIEIPDVFKNLPKSVRLPAGVVEQAFLQANPALDASMITITCKAGMVQEARICLTGDLAPRACAPDAARDCAIPDALMEAVR